MKSVLGILAAGVLAVAPLSIAFAQDSAPVTEPTHVEAPAGEAAVAAVQEFVMEDGTTTMYVENSMAYTMDDVGTKTPVADGEHKLQDGTVVTVKEGVVSGLPVAAETPAMPAEEMPAEK